MTPFFVGVPQIVRSLISSLPLCRVSSATCSSLELTYRRRGGKWRLFKLPRGLRCKRRVVSQIDSRQRRFFFWFISVDNFLYVFAEKEVFKLLFF
jgi:hypothetical protein